MKFLPDLWNSLDDVESGAVSCLNDRLRKDRSLSFGDVTSSSRREEMRQRVEEIAISYEGPDTFATWISSRLRAVKQIRQEIRSELALLLGQMGLRSHSAIRRRVSIPEVVEDRLCRLALDLLDVLGRYWQLQEVERRANITSPAVETTGAK